VAGFCPQPPFSPLIIIPPLLHTVLYHHPTTCVIGLIKQHIIIQKSSPHGGTWGEKRCSSYSFLTSTLDGCGRSASRPGRALHRGKDPGTHCTGGWVGPRTALDTEVRGKILCPCRGSNPDRRVVQPVARHYTD
jgi:hypothetical protein